MKNGQTRKRANKKPKWIIEVDVRALLMLAVTVVMCLLLVASCVTFVRNRMGISKIEITGITRYSNEQIINASQLRRGDPLYKLDKNAIEQKIIKDCPYIESVRITSHFPGTLRMAIEEALPQWYIAIADSCFVLDSNLVMLGESVDEEGLQNEHATKLVLPNFRGVMWGEVPTFGVNEAGESDEVEIRKTLEIISIVREDPFKRRISLLDLSDRFHIVMEVDGKYEVDMGDMTSFDAKLREVKAIIDSEAVQEYDGGTIVASQSPAYFQPKKK